MLNLDYEAAVTAQAIINSFAPNSKPVAKKQKTKLENVITKALGITQEQGLYAASLYLWTRGDAEARVAEIAREQLFSLSHRLLGLTPEAKPTAANYLKFVSASLTSNLSTMIWMKDAWEQTLIYARYGAKTVPEAAEKKG